MHHLKQKRLQEKPQGRAAQRVVKSKRDHPDALEPALKRADELHLKAIKVTCIAAIAGVVIFLGVFFGSDIRNRVIRAKAMTAAQNVSQNHTNAADVKARAARDSVDTKDTQAQDRSDANDSDSNDSKSVASADDSSKKDDTSDVFTVKKSSGVTVKINKQEMEKYLENMSDKQFEAFLDSFSKVSDSNAASDKAETLKEAYAEAEKLFPGQIDGSKRLKLVQELNAVDYLYYVAEDGDTLLKISKAFGIPLGQLVEINGIHDADKIKAGEIILLPSDTKQPDDVVTK